MQTWTDIICGYVYLAIMHTVLVVCVVLRLAREQLGWRDLSKLVGIGYVVGFCIATLFEVSQLLLGVEAFHDPSGFVILKELYPLLLVSLVSSPLVALLSGLRLLKRCDGSA